MLWFANNKPLHRYCCRCKLNPHIINCCDLQRDELLDKIVKYEEAEGQTLATRDFGCQVEDTVSCLVNILGALFQCCHHFADDHCQFVP